MRKLIFILIALISFSQAQTIQYIGAPTTTVISRGNFRTDSIFYLPKRTKIPTDTAAFRYQISDSSLYYWTGYQWTKVQSASSFSSVDTLVISTRAYRQKGDDSLGAIIATKGSGTVTSVATGYGLSGGTITTTGTLIADTLNLSTRAWRQKGLDSLAALEISGSGTTNYISKWNGTTTQNNSNLFQSGTDIILGATSDAYSDVNRSLIAINGTSSSLLSFRNGSTARGYILGNNSAFILNSNNIPIIFNTTEVERMRLKNDGELLINTTTDAGAYTLQNNGALYNTGSAILAANGTSHVGIGTLPSAWSWPNTIMQFRFGGHIAVADNSFMQIGANSYYDGSNYVRVNAGYASRYLQNDGGHFWASATTSTAGSTVTFSENMRLTRDAELLVGTTTDAGNYRVQVSGNAYVTGDAILAASSGNVGIGTTSPTGFSNKILNIYGSASSELHFTTSGSGTANSDGFTIELRDSDGNAQIIQRENKPLVFGTNDNERGRFHANGGFKIVGQSSPPTAEAGTMYYDTDDNKLKVYNGTTWVDLH